MSAAASKKGSPFGAAALVVLCCGPAHGQLPEGSPGRSEITAKNVACGLVAPNPADTSSSSKNFRIEKAKGAIPARRNMAFGISYTLKSFVGTGGAPIRVVFTYPAPGLRDPKTGRLLLTREVTVVQKYDVPQLEYYVFEQDWQLAPGKWLVQIFDRQKRLAECALTLAEPK